MAGGAGWKHQSQGLPGWAAAPSLIPAAKLLLPGTRGLDAAAGAGTGCLCSQKGKGKQLASGTANN